MGRKKQESHEYPTDQADAFLKALTSKCNAYQQREKPKKPSLRDFLSQPAVYGAIKSMLARDKPWSVIAEAVNETFGTALKPTTISAAFGLVAKDKGEPRHVIQEKKIEDRRKAKEAADRAQQQPRQQNPQPQPNQQQQPR